MEEFVAKGFDGARVDQIAEECGLSKNLLYHYYGSKVGLFVAVLERMYETIRHEQDDFAINLGDPETALRELIAHTFSVFAKRPEFISLLNAANLHKAVHIKNSAKIRTLYSQLMKTIEEILEHGAAKGVFKKGIDPVYLYVALASLSYHYISNRYTLRVTLGADLASAKNREAWLDHVTAMVMAYCASGRRSA